MRKNNARITRAYTQRLKGKPDKIFPLLCPVREYEWIEYWKCDLVYSDSGYAENNCVFKTDFRDDLSERTWVVSAYEPDRLIEFIVMSKDNVIRYTITLINDNDDNTLVEWKQIVTALTPEGEKFIKEMTQEKYNEEKKRLEEILNYYLTTGKMMKLP